MKIGRNELCWCGSGKKFKKCHLDRDKQDKLPQSTAMAALQDTSSVATCSCPTELKGECRGAPIRSHSLAKSLGLRAMSVRGHVLGLKHDLQTLKKTRGQAEIGEIGINKATVFPGFCSYHDNNLFKALEQQPFTASPEQCALLSYRAIARERFTKKLGINVNEVLKAATKAGHFLNRLLYRTFLALTGKAYNQLRLT